MVGKDVGEWTGALSSCKFPVGFCSMSTRRATRGGDEVPMLLDVISLELYVSFSPTRAAVGREQLLLGIHLFTQLGEKRRGIR